MSRGRVRSLVALMTGLLVALTVAGCATVPDDSSVQVLRKVTEGGEPMLPPGPADGASPLDVVRGFVNSSGSTENRHAAARRFLTPAAQRWDDSTSVTVLSDEFDTVYARAPSEGRGTAVVRLRGTQLGRAAQDGSFLQSGAPIEIDIQVARVKGQWRIDGAPGGTMIRLTDFQSDFKPVRAYFMDPVGRTPVPDPRYLPINPARTLPSRMVDAVLSGPSDALAGVVLTAIPRTTRLRSNVAETPDGAIVVDLTELGPRNDDQRRMLAAQLMLSLSEVNVTRLRLLDDGAPLLPDQPVITRDAFPEVLSAGDPRPDVAGVVVVGGRVRALTGVGLGGPMTPTPGVPGVVSAAGSADGQRLAAVGRDGGRGLLVGRVGGPLNPTGLRATTLTRPTWTPDGSEVWTVRNGSSVARVLVDGTGPARVAPVDDAALTSLGAIDDLRLSRDGVRVAAIVNGQLVVGAVLRSPSGTVAVRNVRLLLPGRLTSLTAVDWRAADQIAVVGRRADAAVCLLSVDGLDLHPLPTNNLTLPLSSIATGPGRPLLVTDQNGLWSFGADDLGTWRQLVGSPSSIAGFPG